MKVEKTTVGQLINDRGIEWEVIAVYPHYVRARRVWKEDEEHLSEQFKCFDYGQLVMLHLEYDGYAEKEEQNNDDAEGL